MRGDVTCCLMRIGRKLLSRDRRLDICDDMANRRARRTWTLRGWTSGLIALRERWRATLATKNSLSVWSMLMTDFLLTKAGDKLSEELLDLLQFVR